MDRSGGTGTGFQEEAAGIAGEGWAEEARVEGTQGTRAEEQERRDVGGREEAGRAGRLAGPVSERGRGKV